MATTTTASPGGRHEARMRLPRSTGALSGVLIIILGVWGGLIPFVGPYFHYAFGGYAKWHYTNQRLWLDILPAIAAVLGGFALFSAARRPSGVLGGWLAVAGGIWFAVGPVVSLLWHKAGYPIGAPAGNHIRQMLEWLGYFFGIGVLISTLAAFAMGRFVSRPHLVVDEAVAATGVGGAAVADRAGRRRTAGRRGRAAAADVPTARADAPAAGADAPAARADAPTARADASTARADVPAAAGTRTADTAPGTRGTDVGGGDAEAGAGSTPRTAAGTGSTAAETPGTAPGTGTAADAPGTATGATGTGTAGGTRDTTATPGDGAEAIDGQAPRTRRRGGLLGRLRHGAS